MPSQNARTQGAPVPRTTGAPWRPLLSGRLRDRALETVSVLVDGLERADPGRSADGSLSAGAAGIAVCHAMVARARDDGRAADRARNRLDAAIEILVSEPLPPSLYAGFPGIAWAAETVDRLLGEDVEDRNEEIDEALTALVERYPGEEAPYDIVNGLTGLGAYALSRYPRAGSARLISGVADQLARRARRDDAGTSWWTPPSLLFGPTRARYPHGGVDVGMAHGIAGVLPLLARASALGLAPGTLLDDAVRWLSAQCIPTPAGPMVPSFLALGQAPEPARSAWCYGNPGVAAALLLAARDAGRPEWAECAVRLAVAAAARPTDQSGVTDAGLCHGAAGLTHLFNRMHQLTGAPELGSAARGWAQVTVDMCSAAIAADAQDMAPPWNGAGVLEGAAGVALALLAAATETEPIWDSMLLVSPWETSVRAVG